MRINKVYFDVLWKQNSALPYKMLKEALAIAVKTKFLKGQMKTYGNMICYCRNKGSAQFVKKYSNEYLRVALLLKDSMSYAKALQNSAINLRDEGNPDSSLTYLLKSLGIFQRNGAGKDQLARTYGQLSGTYSVLHHYAE